MREYTSPASPDPVTESNLTDTLVGQAISRPHAVGFSRRVGDRWEDITYRDFLAEATAVAKGLAASGVNEGDRVGLMSRTRYEWTLFDFAIWLAGAVPVPDLRDQLRRAGPVDPQRLRRRGRRRRD